MSFELAFAFAIAHRLYLIDVFKLSPYVATAFADLSAWRPRRRCVSLGDDVQ